MRRPFACLLTLTSAVVAQPVAACSCIKYSSQAEGEAAGEQAYAAADLIVDATPGDTPAAFKRICFAVAGKPRPADYGREIPMHRTLAIHRVIKGKAPRTPMLFAEPAEVTQYGCGIMNNSCDIKAASGQRSILVLRKVVGGRYQPLSLCEMIALRRSRRGQALFNGAG